MTSSSAATREPPKRSDGDPAAGAAEAGAATYADW